MCKCCKLPCLLKYSHGIKRQSNLEGCILGSALKKKPKKHTNRMKEWELLEVLGWRYGWWLRSWAPALHPGRSLPASWGVWCTARQPGNTCRGVKSPLRPSSPCTRMGMAGDELLALGIQQTFLEVCGADDPALKTIHQLLSGVTRPNLVYHE